MEHITTLLLANTCTGVSYPNLCVDALIFISFFDSLHLLAIIWGMEGNLQWCNPAFDAHSVFHISIMSSFETSVLFIGWKIHEKGFVLILFPVILSNKGKSHPILFTVTVGTELYVISSIMGIPCLLLVMKYLAHVSTSSTLSSAKMKLRYSLRGTWVLLLGAFILAVLSVVWNGNLEFCLGKMTWRRLHRQR